MKLCDYCGKDLTMWPLDENRILKCDVCVLEALPYPKTPVQGPQSHSKRKRYILEYPTKGIPSLQGRCQECGTIKEDYELGIECISPYRTIFICEACVERICEECVK